MSLATQRRFWVTRRDGISCIAHEVPLRRVSRDLDPVTICYNVEVAATELEVFRSGISGLYVR